MPETPQISDEVVIAFVTGSGACLSEHDGLHNQSCCFEAGLAAALAEVRSGHWIVPKVASDVNQSVRPYIADGWIRRDQGVSDPEHARVYAAQLLAAADEAEGRR